MAGSVPALNKTACGGGSLEGLRAENFAANRAANWGSSGTAPNRG